jgi:hypothetical protein
MHHKRSREVNTVHRRETTNAVGPTQKKLTAYKKGTTIEVVLEVCGSRSVAIPLKIEKRPKLLKIKPKRKIHTLTNIHNLSI